MIFCIRRWRSSVHLNYDPIYRSTSSNKRVILLPFLSFIFSSGDLLFSNGLNTGGKLQYVQYNISQRGDNAIKTILNQQIIGTLSRTPKGDDLWPGQEGLRARLFAYPVHLQMVIEDFDESEGLLVRIAFDGRGRYQVSDSMRVSIVLSCDIGRVLY